MKKYIYFDNAATSKPNKICNKIITKYTDNFYNPSALYLPAYDVKKDIENARESIQKKLRCHKDGKIIFTPSATIANNFVLNNMIQKKNKNYIISAGEHSSVYKTAKELLNNGYDIRFAPILKTGHVNVKKLLELIDENTIFVSLIHVSNETGAINDLESIVKLIREKKKDIIIHSDGVQAVGKIDINLQKLDLDYYTISGHKIGTHRGVAALYIRYIAKQSYKIHGGGQEFNIVSGTENLAGIVCLDSLISEKIINKSHITSINKIIIEGLSKVKDCIIFYGPDYVKNIIMVCFKNVRSESIIHIMQEKGYLLGSGSACNSKDKINRVLDQMKVSKDYMLGAIRISFSSDISVADAKNMTEELVAAVNDYRRKV